MQPHRLGVTIATLAMAGTLAACGTATGTDASSPSPSASKSDPVPAASKSFDDAMKKIEQQLEDDYVATCHKLVKRNLKSPATASFASTQVTHPTKYSYRIKGGVDAENGFGALLRLHYQCTGRKGSVHLDYLRQPS